MINSHYYIICRLPSVNRTDQVQAYIEFSHIAYLGGWVVFNIYSRTSAHGVRNPPQLDCLLDMLSLIVRWVALTAVSYAQKELNNHIFLRVKIFYGQRSVRDQLVILYSCKDSRYPIYNLHTFYNLTYLISTKK